LLRVAEENAVNGVVAIPEIIIAVILQEK